MRKTAEKSSFIGKKLSFKGKNQVLCVLVESIQISDTDFNALSQCVLHLVVHGSSNNRLFQRFWLAVENFQPIRGWLKKLPWRAKPRLPCGRALKTVPETGVKCDLAFCLGSLNDKTNSGEGSLMLKLFCYHTIESN